MDPNVNEIQSFQRRLVSAMMAAAELRRPDAVEDLRSEYQETVDQLIRALGPNAVCCAVDLIVWDTYLAKYAAMYGRCPTVLVSHGAAKAFVDQ